MDNPWKKISSKISYQNSWFRVREDEVVRPDGSKGNYGIVETNGPSVFIVALTPELEVYLIKLFRYPTQKWSWELPGGGFSGLAPLEEAKKELQEETGLVASQWISLGSAQVMNGVCNEMSHFFIAKNLKEAENKAKEEGIVQIKKFPFTEVLEMIKDGEFDDGQSMSAILKASLYLDKLK